MGQLWVTDSQGQKLYSPLLMEEVLQAAQPDMKLLQFCQRKEAFGKNAGETFLFDMYSDYDQASTAGASNLTETATVPSGSIVVYQGTGTLYERGKALPFTKKYETLAQVGGRQDIVKALSNHYAKQTESDVEAEFDRTKIRYVGTSTAGGGFTTNGTATLTCTSQYNDYHCQQMVDYLYGTLKCAYYDSDNYVAVCTVNAANGIYNALEDIQKYTKYPMTGEAGKYYNCRHVKTNTPAMSNAMGASSAYGEAYMFGGDGPVWWGEAVPMQIIPKEVTDYQRSLGLAWYDVVGFVLARTLNPDAEVIKFTSA